MKAVFFIIFFTMAFAISSNELIDTSSFIAKYRAQDLEKEGSSAASRGDLVLSVRYFIRSYSEFHSLQIADTISYVLTLISKLGDNRADKTFFTSIIDSNAVTLHDLHLLGLESHFNGHHTQAIATYQAILESSKREDLSKITLSEIYFSLCVSFQHFGDFNNALQSCLQSNVLDPMNIRAGMNLAAIHHKFGALEDAIPAYEKIISLLSQVNATIDQVYMLRSNYGVALYQIDSFTKATSVFSDTADLLREIYIRNCATVPSNLRYEDCSKLVKYEKGCVHKLYTIQKSSANWYRFEQFIADLSSYTLEAALQKLSSNTSVLTLQETRDLGTTPPDESFQGPLLPFDTLLVSMSLENRLIVGKAFSANFLSDATFLSSMVNERRSSKLRLGFISFDFNDHPTAHLIEGIFEIIANGRSLKSKHDLNLFDSVHTVIFSYGKDDGSEYRKNLERTPDEYVDLATETRIASINSIRSRDIDILLDMQLYTLGHRAEVIAARPAGVQVSYLVYPGSSGAHFLDFIVVDRVVVPPEHATFYSEKLLFLPPSYQISYYERYRELNHSPSIPPFYTDKEHQKMLRNELGLPNHPEVIILCNFNKLDKLEPQTFQIWMQIMSRVRHSYLWLLLPSKHTEKNDLAVNNLFSIAQFFGIEKGRLIFAPRVSKAEHIRRHLAADLFLDSIVYGAHSTSTDALRGGLPVLTLEGGDFPNRVASSLYASFNTESVSSDLQNLICHSTREYEDVAVNLLLDETGYLLLHLRGTLQHTVWKNIGIFNAEMPVRNFLRSMMVLKELARFREIDKRYYYHASLSHY